MRIGEVARLVGISARSIRHYHRIGVMDEPARTSGGYRDYDVADLARIARIAFLSDSGVPLREIGAMLDADTVGSPDAAADLAAIRDGIDEQIAQLTRQRDRLDVIARRAADGLPPGLLPEPVTRALDICKADAADDPELVALVDREHDMLDLVALNGDFPEALARSYVAIGADADRRRDYLDLLAGFQRIHGRRPAEVEPEIARLVETLVGDDDIRALVTGATDGQTPEEVVESGGADSNGPTLEQLLPDAAQREVVGRTLHALDVIP